MRALWISLALSICCAAAFAQTSAPMEDTRRAQVQAAIANAAANLHDQILAMPLSREFAVRDLVDRTHGNDALNVAIQNAQQIGGPRWIDEKTCQVRLQISGLTVAEALRDLARAHPDLSPIPDTALKQKLGEWIDQTFSAVGSSAVGDSIELAQPHYDVGAWADVPITARRKAVGAAKQAAIQHAMDTLATIPLSGTLKVQDALNRPGVSERVQQWLHHQPVTRIEFLDDLHVSVSLSVPPKNFVSALQTAIAGEKDLTGGVDWTAVRREITNHPDLAVGSATAVAAPAPTTAVPAMVPAGPPVWIDQELHAESSATGSGPRLKVARAAEATATTKLRSQLMLLPFSPGVTLAQAVKTDAKMAQAIDRAMLHAHTVKVQYSANGAVAVQVSLELREVWDEIQSGL